MIRKLLIFFLLALPSWIIAQPAGDPEHVPGELNHQYHQAWISQSVGFEVQTEANFMLYDTLITWLGTPYRFAGNCEKGIDCSGFVNVLYNHVLGIKLGARNSG